MVGLGVVRFGQEADSLQRGHASHARRHEGEGEGADDRRPDGDPHYKVSIRVDLANLEGRQQDIAIRPGLQATVELHTGEKTVLSYLTKPLYRGREALHEP